MYPASLSIYRHVPRLAAVAVVVVLASLLAALLVAVVGDLAAVAVTSPEEIRLAPFRWGTISADLA